MSIEQSTESTNWIDQLLVTSLLPVTKPISCFSICVGNCEELMPLRRFIGDNSSLTAIDTQRPNNNGLRRIASTNTNFIQADGISPCKFFSEQPGLVVIRNPQIESVDWSTGETTYVHDNILQLVGNWAEAVSSKGQMLITAYTFEEQQRIVDELECRGISPSHGSNRMLPEEYWRIKGNSTVQIPDGFTIVLQK